MKKFEHKNKDERRRVLLSKNNELSYTFDNEKLPEENEAVQTNGVGVMAKLGALTRKQLRALIAILVALAVIVPSLVFFALHGKAAGSVTDDNHLVFEGNMLDVPDAGMKAGSYLITIGGKDWTYNFEQDYYKGDKLRLFPDDNNRITVYHDPDKNGMTNITSEIDASHIQPSGNTITINLGAGEALTPETKYYYLYNSKYYVFSFSKEILGEVDTGDYSATINEGERKHTLPLQKDNVQIIIDTTTGLAKYSDTSSGYDRKTIYTEVKDFSPNGIYLITQVEGEGTDDYIEYLLNYHAIKDGTEQTAYSDDTSYSHRNSHEPTDVFYPFAVETFPSSVSEAPDFFASDYSPKTFAYDSYFDASDPQLAQYILDGTEDILPEFQAKASPTSDYWFLRGYHVDDATFSEKKTFGSIYNWKMSSIATHYNKNLYHDVFLYALFTQTGHNFYMEHEYGQDRDKRENVDFTQGSIWKYDGTCLINDKYLLNEKNSGAVYLGIGLPEESSEDQNAYFTRSVTAGNNKIYKMEDVFVKSKLPTLSSYQDSYSEDNYYPSIISYTDSNQSVDGLETKKTVSTTADRDIFHVKLEGYMTEQSIKLPTTDIVLTLDLSGRMNDTLYNREYKNLKTQTLFSEVSLTDVTHDNMYDPNNPRNEGNWDIAGWDRGYTDNKYIEDPNSPGTYIYLAQTYTFKNLKHYYQYSFTSSTGAIYKSPVYEKRILGGVIGKINALTFTRRGGAALAGNSVKNVTLTSFYTRTGTNKDAALTDQSTTSLYEQSESSEGLWYKYTDGQYYPVSVTPGTSVTVKGETFYQDYTFSVTVPVKQSGGGTVNKTFSVSYGNDFYGAKNAVFQGFKKYKTVNGKLVVDQAESLPGKTLYAYVGKTENKGNSEVTRMDAMKENIESLLLQLNEDAVEKGSNVRVAVTCFSRLTTDDTRYHLGDVDMADTRAVDSMISDIYGYVPVKRVIGNRPTKNARIDVGTAAANNEFAANSPDGNKRYELVYTAGVPSKSIDGSLDLSVANSAINNAYVTKTKYGATVYSVGLFYYANEDHLNGDYFYYNSHPWYKCTGEVGSTWGKSTGYSWFGSRDIDPMDADVTNRMLNYISSNFADATQTGLSYSGLYNPGFMQNPVKWFLATHGPGYRINRNFTRTATGYYYGISPVVRTATADEDGYNGTETERELTAEALEARFTEVFGNIASGMKAPRTILSTGTKLVDGITDYYDLVDFDGNGKIDEDDILAYAANINANTNTDDEIPIPSITGITKALSDHNKTITVEGFDYSEHYIAGGEPAKLVVEFDIKRIDNFIGGNRVPTNTAASAILDEDGRLEDRFRIPAIDLYIDKGDNLGKDQSVYYSCEADLSNAFNLDDANGMNNAYSDLVYEIYDNAEMTGDPIGTYTVLHGDSVGTWSDAEHAFNPSSDSISDADLNQMYPQIREDKTYYVKCTVEPWLDGTIEDTPITSDKNVSHVYVFKPHLTASDLRISEAGEVYVDELVNTTNGQSDRYDVLSKKVIEWKHDGNAVVPNPTTAPPAIEYRLKDLTHSGNPIYDPFEIDGTTGKVKDMAAINIANTTDFQIVDLKVAERTFEYEVRRWIEEDVTYTDEETNETFTEHYEYWGDVSGSKERSAESLTFEGETPSAYYVNDKDLNNDSGKLTTDASRPNGKFTILLSKPFTLKVQKEFKGDYAVAGPVTIQVKDADGTLVAQKLFAKEDFSQLKSGVAEVVLETGKTLESGDYYTVSETGVDTEFYTVTYAGTSEQDTLITNYNSETDAVYTFKTDTTNDIVTVVVTNTWKTEKNPPITGVFENSKLNPFFIAAAVIALLGGSGTAYAVKRKKETGA